MEESGQKSPWMGRWAAAAIHQSTASDLQNVSEKNFKQPIFRTFFQANFLLQKCKKINRLL
jgi:hypothetical protein